MRNFANSLITPYRGAFGAQVITAHQKSATAPQGVSITISWFQYALAMNIAGGVTVFNGGVSIDLSRGTVANALDLVKSVFIDNTAVDRPVYLRCEDTGQVITCADSSFGWFPVITNGEQFTLFTDNIIPLRDAKQQTRLIFSNAAFDTFGGSEYNRAQSLFRGSGISNYTTPVIGDKMWTRSLTAQSQSSSQNYTIEPATPNTQVIITAISGEIFAANSTNTGTFQLKVTFSTDIVNFFIDNWQGTTSAKVIDLNNLQLSYDISAIPLTAFINAISTSGTSVGQISVTYAKITVPALS